MICGRVKGRVCGIRIGPVPLLERSLNRAKLGGIHAVKDRKSDGPRVPKFLRNLMILRYRAD